VSELHTGLQHTWQIPSVDFVATRLEEFNHTVYCIQGEVFDGDNRILRYLYSVSFPGEYELRDIALLERHREKLRALGTALAR
jgi:hypothetical protein